MIVVCMSEKQTPTLAQRVADLRVGKSFIVKTAAERIAVYEAVRTLKQLGKLQHEVKTMPTPGGFKVYAI